VPLLALAIREPADGKEIGRFEEANTVSERQPLTRCQLVGDLDQTGVPQTCRGE